MLKFLGVPSSIYLAFFLLYSYRANKDLKLTTDPLSNVGNGKRYCRFFNTSMLLTALLRLIYYLSVIVYFSLTDNLLLMLSVVIAEITMILISIFPTGKFQKIHRFSALSMFLSSFSLIILLGLELTLKGSKFGLVYLLNSLVVFIGCLLLYKKYKTAAITELLFVIGMIIGDLIMLIMLL